MMVVVCVAAIVHGGGSLDVCSGAKNATFCAIYIQNRTFYQDRLGTNIGKVEKRVAFFAEILLTAPPGSCIVFNSHLWHGGTANNGRTIRRAM